MSVGNGLAEGQRRMIEQAREVHPERDAVFAELGRAIVGDESVSDILRPLAESADERFAALRTGFPFIDDWSGGNHEGVRTDLGSIVRAAAACGLYICELGEDMAAAVRGRFIAHVSSHDDPWWYHHETGHQGFREGGSGRSVEMAAARALRAACEALGIVLERTNREGP